MFFLKPRIGGKNLSEFLTHAPCSQPTVRLVLEYQPGRGYAAAGARFAAFYIYTADMRQNADLSAAAGALP